jgi:branched-chain amino acid transport system substrate-binding protein
MLIGAAATLAASACTDGPDPDPTVPDGSDDILVGVSLELTGPASALGVLQERALRITAEQLNTERVPVGATRRGLRLVVRDNIGQAGTATTVARQLIEQDRVHALIGGTLAETSLATIAVAQDRQLPMISLANADGIVRPRSRRTFVYKVAPDAGDVASRLVRTIARQKLRRVAALATTGPYGDSGMRATQEAIDAAGLDLVRAVRLPTAVGELPAAARRLTDAAPEAMVIWATAPAAGNIARAMRTAGFAGRFFFDAGAVAEATLSGATAAAVEGAYVVHPAMLDTSALTNTTLAGLARRAFVFRYIQLHGSFKGFAPYASDALTMITAAARRAGNLEPGPLRDHLENMTIEGIAGSYAFSPDHHGGMGADSLALFTVERGAWARVS